MTHLLRFPTRPQQPSATPMSTASRVPLADVQGSLALDLTPRAAAPHVAPSRVRGADAIEIHPRLREQMEAWTARFAQAAVEIVGGDRPVTQLLRWTSVKVYRQLEHRAAYVARAGGHTPALARVQPVRPRVASVHTCFLTAGIVETGLRIAYGNHSRALAGRFERIEDPSGPRWICTALEWS